MWFYNRQGISSLLVSVMAYRLGLQTLSSDLNIENVKKRVGSLSPMLPRGHVAIIISPDVCLDGMRNQPLNHLVLRPT